MKGARIFPSPCEELTQTPKTPPTLSQYLLYLEKTQLQFEIPSKEYTGDAIIAKKGSYGLSLQGHRMLIVKKVMGNRGKADVERSNGQGSPTRSWDMERLRWHHPS